MTPTETRPNQTPAEVIETHQAPPGAPRGVATMSIVRWVLVLLAALVATASIVGFAGAHLGADRHASSAQLYQCPMHPSVVQDHPGECPICSMTLVPKTPEPEGVAKRPASASQVAGLVDIRLTPERIQLIGMRTAPVERGPIGGDLRTVGVVAANENGLAQINTRFGGWIQKLLVAETGQRVRRGQVLATIYSPEVFQAEQELLLAHGWSSAPATDSKPSAGTQGPSGSLDADARRRLELLGIAPPEIDDLLRTGKAAEAIPIRSPVDGFVVGKNAVAGVAVQSGSVLFEVADLSQVWVTADVYEQDIARVHIGQRARLELAAYPGETQTGKVTFIAPVLDTANRTLRVRLEFKNRSDRNGPRLRPGMYGTVYLDAPSATGLTVPSEAVVDTGQAHTLFVSQGAGRFEPRKVTVGAHLNDRVQILSGVSEGETVVTTGNFLIDSESRLRSAIEGR